MSEKILTSKNHGFPVLLALIVSFIIAIAGISYAIWGMIEYFYNRQSKKQENIPEDYDTEQFPPENK